MCRFTGTPPFPSPFATTAYQLTPLSQALQHFSVLEGIVIIQASTNYSVSERRCGDTEEWEQVWGQVKASQNYWDCDEFGWVGGVEVGQLRAGFGLYECGLQQ